ncbi:MAG TPA: class I SAM-dependent methyltransferase [Planctomycetota bacterium]|nr:class I SAM-dependent methyltransferase [Planctomycetota bacterium]
MSSLERWYVEAFRSDYRRVYAHRDVASARDEVGFLIGHGLQGRVLDLCCGFGRHTLAMRERGLDAVGLDLSMELLLEARTLENGSLLDGRLLRGDAAALPFHRGSFDGVVNLFSSFGYFGELGDARMLSEIARVQKPGAIAILDLMNPAFVRANLRSQSSREGQDFLVRETRTLADGGRRVTKEVELRLPESGIRRWREDVRLYEEIEMRSLLAGRGLRVETVHGDFDGRPFGPESPRMVITARH